MVLAFRFYGNFQWPPSFNPPGSNVPGNRQLGLVEIHFAQLNPAPAAADSLDYKAFLRWRPGAVDLTAKDHVEPPVTDDNVFLISNPSGKFSSSAETRLWIFDPKNKFGRKLAFRGAFLFEQYPKDRSAPETAWPLVRECRYRSDEPSYFSTLIIGQDENDNFRFDLQLPVPFPQTSRKVAEELNPPTLPFSAVYNARKKDPAQATRIDTLVMGASGRHERTFEQAKNFNVSSDKRRLGLFGFSSDGQTAQGFAVSTGNTAELDTGPAPVDVGYYWPDPRLPHPIAISNVALQAFRRFGFKVDPAKFAALDFENDNEKELSIRFPPQTNLTDWRNGSLVYRLAISTNSPEQAGDLGWSSSDFGLALQDELDGMLGIDASKLYIDIVQSWSFPVEKIWSSDRRSEWTPRQTLRLHWEETLGGGLLSQRADSGDSLYRRGTLSDAAAAMIAVHSALRYAEGGQPQTLLPSLSVDPQKLRFCLTSPAIDLPATADPADFEMSGLLPSGAEGPIRPTMHLSLADEASLIAGEHSPDLEVSATLPEFFPGSVELPLFLQCDPQWMQADIHFDDNQVRYFASFNLVWGKKPTSNLGFNGRLSSLQFAFDTDTVMHQTDGATAEGNRVDKLKTGGPGVRVAGRPCGARFISKTPTAVSFSTKLGVKAIRPVGVDIPRDDRTGRPAPLLIPLGDDDAKGGFVLEINEQLSATQDRLLTAQIYDQSSETRGRDYVLLAQEPFSLLRFAEARLGARGDAANAAVAAYSSNDRIWTLKQVAEFYHYILPPQVAGESADKPRRLHIHDLPSDAPASAGPIRPYDDTPPDDPDHHHPEYDPKLWHDLHRRAIEFRLAPSAEIWLRPSDVERGYFMPAWDSFELFRQRGELGLGASLAGLRGEFLYGLPVGVDVSRERGVSRQARVTEIEALTGRVVGEPRHEPDAPLAKRWNSLAAAVARRPERLEVWAFDPDSAVDFAPARFADGVSFAFRQTALHRAPVKGRGDEFERPEDIAAAPQGAATRFHPQGLGGGALWPVESANLFRALQDRPASNGGSIESIALSPIGGDAVQKAEFLNGIVSIISETRNGFVQRQKVEVIGRIGALWHRAKHVVVYERTVNPTAQFAPRYEEDPRYLRSRRPILRKVREYVELIEWERSYPDFAEALPRSVGFLDRVRFNSRIINVDSAWSHDVGTFGWEIPLWNRASARQRPQVYPMPDVAFVTAAEGDGDKPVVAQETRDPEKLYFFADFSANTSETNVWQVRLAVDFVNMPSSTNLAEIVDRKSTDDPTEDSPRRPGVGRVLPGASRFTWRLAPAARKSALNAGRSAKPVYVGLDSVTFMRSTQKVAEVPGDLKGVLGTKDGIKGYDEYTGIAATKYWTKDGKGVPPETPGQTSVAEYRDAVTKVIAAAQAEPPSLPVIQGAVKNLRDQLSDTAKVQKSIAGSIKDALGDANKFKGAIKDASALIGKGEAQCEKLKSDALALIQGKSALVVENIRTWENDAESVLVKFWQASPIKTELIGKLSDDVINLLRPVFAEASADVGRGVDGVETARAIIADTDAEIEAVIERARSRVMDFSAAYDRSKPWSPTRRAAFQAGLYAAIGSVVDDIHGALDEARHRFGVELGNASQAIGGHLSRVLAELAKDKIAALKTLVDLDQALSNACDLVDKRLLSLLPKTEGGGGLLDAAPDAIKKARDKVAAASIDAGVKQKALGILDAATAAVAAVMPLARDGRTQAAKIKGLGDKASDTVGAAVVELAAKLSGLVTQLANTVAGIASAVDLLLQAGFDAAHDDLLAITNLCKSGLAQLDRGLAKVGETPDLLVAEVTDSLDSLLGQVRSDVADLSSTLMDLADDVGGALQGIQDALAPNSLMEAILNEKVIKPALETVLKPLPESLDDVATMKALKASAAEDLSLLSTEVSSVIANLKSDALDAIKQISSFCSVIAEDANAVLKYFNDLQAGAEDYVKAKIDGVLGGLGKQLEDFSASLDDVDKVVSAVNALDYTVRGIQNDLGRSAEAARMYSDRVMDAFTKVDLGNPLTAPSNILKLYSAVTTAPEIAALKADIDRIRAGFDEAADIIDTTRATALFNHLGDELKALGIALPFDSIGEKIQAVTDIANFNISDVFKNLGGAKFAELTKGYKLPDGAGDAISITHDFDKTKMLAWVQVDINLPMPGRRSLFSLEVFQADLVEMNMTGQVRLEVSKDSQAVSQTGFGRVDANLDMVVGGQSMVTFQSLAFHFTRESGLKVEFDPARIKLNPAFQFIQDLLSSLFPDELGGLKIIKRDGIPIGLEHEFALPAISLMFGTSGVSNISISNRFQLLAFPDFILADRFSLSRPEMPFIFSIFIIGGTGYIQLEAEYQPFHNDLMVTVEAAAGGSATLGLSFGPFSGSVFIALSITITYRKVIGKSGGGLSIGLLLVIAGSVTVCSIVTIGIYLMLRISYRDNGQVDADGTLSVTISISRFFKIHARADVHYKLRGGHSETTVNTSVSAEPEDKRLQQAANKLKQARG